jgi:pimeloyl-ACP methyl ester carboxylesterase
VTLKLNLAHPRFKEPARAVALKPNLFPLHVSAMDAKRQLSLRERPKLAGRMPIFFTIAGAMAAAAIAVRYQTRKAEQANPPQGRFLEIDGVRLHYVERGEGPPLVLLHGNGTMIQDYELSGILDMASQRYRVIVFDRPGYGHSSRPRRTIWHPVAQAHLLHKALQRLGVEAATVVGHSWGTLVALSLALEHPADVNSLALLSGYYFPTARLDVPVLSPPAIPIIGDLMRYTISPLLGRLMWPGLMRLVFGPPRTPEHFKTFPRWMSLRPSQLRAAAAESAMMVPAALALRRRYRELTVPVMIVAGARDRVANADAHSKRLHRQLPGSTLQLVPGMGHMIHHLAPREVMAAIDAAAAARLPIATPFSKPSSVRA